jgi:RNA polymerase sigma-70 factor, ECF subfamily
MSRRSKGETGAWPRREQRSASCRRCVYFIRLFGLDKHLERSGSGMNRSDEHLLELALQGDGASFGELSERWRRKIFSFVCRYVGNAEEAEDLTQDTFAKAFQNLDRLADPARFSSWLYKIALNECRMRFRKKKNHSHVSLADEDEAEGIDIVDGITPENRLRDKEVGLALRQAVEALPEEQREVILMKEYQNLKFQEISDITNVPLSTVKSRMYLGLKTLRRLMENRL